MLRDIQRCYRRDDERGKYMMIDDRGIQHLTSGESDSEKTTKPRKDSLAPISPCYSATSVR
jgi:hypothetical protein